jgi:hypothetical protein
MKNTEYDKTDNVSDSVLLNQFMVVSGKRKLFYVRNVWDIKM